MSNEYAEESHDEDNENETYQPSLNSENEEIPKLMPFFLSLGKYLRKCSLFQ